MILQSRCLLLSVLQMAAGQNSPIITSMFGAAEPQIIFDENTADVNVQCNPTHMCVSIDEQYFINNRQHVMDMGSVIMREPCEGNRTMEGSMLTLCTGVFGSLGCGLSFELNETHVAYVTTLETGNATVSHSNGNKTIVRYEIPFQCTFPLEELLTLEAETGEKYGHYIPRIFQAKIITVLIKEGEGLGRFPVSMFLYKDASYLDIHAEPPTKNVSDTLYVRLVLAKSPENAVIQARRCWATPFEDPEGPVQFTLIDDFCAAPVEDADPELSIAKNGVSNYAEWTSKVFQFSGDEFSERVYLHCIAKVCFEGDGQPSCNKVPCPNGRKKRAAYGGVGALEDTSNEVRLSLGPIIITKEVMQIAAQISQNPSLDFGQVADYEPVQPMDELTVMEPLIGGAIISALIIIILVLIAIVVVVAKRKISESKS